MSRRLNKTYSFILPVLGVFGLALMVWGLSYLPYTDSPHLDRPEHVDDLSRPVTVGNQSVSTEPKATPQSEPKTLLVGQVYSISSELRMAETLEGNGTKTIPAGSYFRVTGSSHDSTSRETSDKRNRIWYPIEITDGLNTYKYWTHSDWIAASMAHVDVSLPVVQEYVSNAIAYGGPLAFGMNLRLLPDPQQLPVLFPWQVQPNRLGYIERSKVVQVIDPDTMLVNIDSGLGETHVVMLKGLSTQGIAEGSIISTSSVMTVGSNTSYTTIFGETRNVYTLTPFAMTPYQLIIPQGLTYAVDETEGPIVQLPASPADKSRNLELLRMDEEYVELRTQERKTRNAIDETRELMEKSFERLAQVETVDDYNRVMLFRDSLETRLYWLKFNAIRTRVQIALLEGDDAEAKRLARVLINFAQAYSAGGDISGALDLNAE